MFSMCQANKCATQNTEKVNVLMQWKQGKQKQKKTFKKKTQNINK